MADGAGGSVAFRLWPPVAIGGPLLVGWLTTGLWGDPVDLGGRWRLVVGGALLLFWRAVAGQESEDSTPALRPSTSSGLAAQTPRRLGSSFRVSSSWRRRVAVAREGARLGETPVRRSSSGHARSPAGWRSTERAGQRDPIEGKLVEIGMRAASLGINVILDFALWSKDERAGSVPDERR